MAGYFGLGLVLLGLGIGQYWLQVRPVPSPPQITMAVDIYPVGDGWILHRRVSEPRATVVVMHGLLENPLYFTRYYDDPELELIMIGATGYQLPVTSPDRPEAPWDLPPTGTPGTIAADAQLLNLALEHLPGTRNTRVHGHSRGGAVILQAASERPDLFSQVEVILEAPVLPQGQPYRPSSAISRLLLPSLHLLWQRRPDMLLEQPIWGPLDDPDKRELIRAMPFNPRSSALLLTNVRDLLGWMDSTSTEIYRHVQRGAILVPGRDRVLNSAAMLDSAHQAENLQIVEVPEGSHFVLLDNPESIPPLRNP